MKRRRTLLLFLPATLLLIAAIAVQDADRDDKRPTNPRSAEDNARQLIEQGRNIFRFDTYGDEAFWTGQLQIQQSGPGPFDKRA